MDRDMDKLSSEPRDHPADAYPSRHPKGSFWATDEAWDILDRLPVGTLDNTQRAYLSGLIAGKLVNERDERNELQQTFDLRWKADMRAIKRWQAAHHGKENIWPDHADLVVWLMEELERRT